MLRGEEFLRVDYSWEGMLSSWSSAMAATRRITTRVLSIADKALWDCRGITRGYPMQAYRAGELCVTTYCGNLPIATIAVF
jgi:hypothetical protein